MQRISIVGNSGSGKTTVARQLAAILDVPHIELDAIFHQPGPRHRVMRQVLRRTLGRTLLRRELWNGNREPLANLWSRDPQRSIIAWAWSQHESYRQRYGAAMHDGANAHLRFVRVSDDPALAAVLGEAAAAGRA
jgi:dephospho-CoA kinase